MPTPDTDADEQDALVERLLERMEHGVIAVLEEYSRRLHKAGAHEAGRYELTEKCLRNVFGRVMRSDIDRGVPGAQVRCDDHVDFLKLFIAPRTERAS